MNRAQPNNKQAKAQKVGLRGTRNRTEAGSGGMGAEGGRWEEEDSWGHHSPVPPEVHS